MTKGQVSGAQVISKTCRLLYEFDSHSTALSLMELTKRTQLNSTTAYRILQALVFEGLVYQDPDTGKYSLGYRLVMLGELAKQSNSLLRIITPYVEQVAAQFGETTLVDTLDRNIEVVSLLQIPAAYRLTTAPRYGQAMPAHCTSAGKVLLAYASPELIGQYLARGLKQFTPNTIVEPEKLRAELDKIRAQGFATNLEEEEIGLNAIAVPIFDMNRQVVAALSIGGPVTRINTGKIPEFADSLLKAGQQISNELSFSN